MFAGPNNIAYGATKADQAHQVRLLAAELGEHGSGSTASTPTASSAARASSPAAGAPARRRLRRAEEDKLGEFYAQRTLLKREVLPEHVADAVFALTGGELTRTTGLHVPVDSGVAAAFLR